MKTSSGTLTVNKVVKLGIAAKGSYAYGHPRCLRFEHLTCGWDGVRF